MKKFRTFKMMALVLCMMLLCSMMPTMVFAADAMVVKGANVMPGGQDITYYDSAAAGVVESGGGDTIVLRQGEWVKYSLAGLEPGEYMLSITHGCKAAVGYDITINDNDKIYSKKVIAATGAYLTFKEYEVGMVTIPNSDSTITIMDNSTSSVYFQQFKLISMKTVEKKAALAKQSRAYVMSYLPCIIEAENFDSGAAGVAYFDSDPGNMGGAYRETADVDIYKAGDATYVNMGSGDWMTYTISCDKPADYDLVAKMTDVMEESKVRIYMDGYEILRLIPEKAMPTGEEMTETTLGTFFIDKGVHSLQIKCLDGDINIDYMRFRKSKADGIDISDTTLLRAWKDSQELSEEDLAANVVVNPVERELYVDASKATNGDGSENSPFNSLDAAKAYIRTINKNMKGDIVVNLKGDFKLNETLVFSEEDSGSDIYNVIYRGDGDTSIHGGRKVTGWKQAEGSPLWQTTLSDVEDFRQLYIGENRGMRARTEWLYHMKAEWNDPANDYAQAEGVVVDASDFIGGFSRPQDMEMVWQPSWRWVCAPIDDIVKNGDGDYIVHFPHPYFKTIFTTSGALDFDKKNLFYLQNAPEFLDRPGEFYFNKDTKVLTYYPFDYEDMTTIDCYIPEVETLMQVRGTDKNSRVKNLAFEGIQFKFGGWEQPSTKGFSTIQADMMLDPDNVIIEDFSAAGTAFGTKLVHAQIQVDFASNITFTKNEFKQLGSNCLGINNATDNCLVEGNLFDNFSGTAVAIGDWVVEAGDPLDEYTRKTMIRNNLIRRPGVEYLTPVITAYYTNKATIDHNDIQDAPYTGISMCWGWGIHGREYATYYKATNNRIDNVMYRLRDGGHIYTLGVMTGSVISGNYMTRSGDWKGGVYTDEGTAYLKIIDNVFGDGVARWLKSTRNTNYDNISYGNYARYNGNVVYPELNKFEDATIVHYKDPWPEEAQAIMDNAGLQDDYKYLLEDYESRPNLRNATLEPHRYFEGDMVIEAGNYMEGDQGTAYYDTADYDWTKTGFAVGKQPYRRYEANGACLLTIENTAQGEWTKYKFNIEEAGEYDIYAALAVVQEDTAVTVDIDEKTVVDKLKVAPNCKAYEKYDNYLMGTFYLSEGEHTLRLEHAVKNFAFGRLIFNKKGTHPQRVDGYNQALMDVVLAK